MITVEIINQLRERNITNEWIAKFTEIADFAKAKLKEHNLLTEHKLTTWKFEFDKAKRRFGSCNWSKRLITVSFHLANLNPIEESKETILHEIAHALAGSKAGHGYEWKQTALAIGSNGKRCHSANEIPKKWLAFCEHCQRNCGRYHRRRNLNHRICHTKLIYIEIANN